jgi:hypothetical protein
LRPPERSLAVRSHSLTTVSTSVLVIIVIIITTECQSDASSSRKTAGPVRLSRSCCWWLMRCVTMRTSEQFRLQCSTESEQRRKWRDRRRQTVPHLRGSDGEGAVANSHVIRPRDKQRRWRRRTKPSARVNVGDALQLAGKIQRRRTAQTAVNKNRKAELDPLRDSEPMKVTEERRHVFAPPRRVDETDGRFEDWLQSVELPSGKTSQGRAAVVESRQCQCRD